MELINQETMAIRRSQLPSFGPGDQVRVWCKIIERDRTRLAPFEGIVVRRRGAGISETFIVRRVTHGEGVERVFPVHAPTLERVELLQRARPKRSRLYYLRSKIGKTRIATIQPGSSPKAASPGQAAETQSAAATPSPETQPTGPASSAT